MEPTRLDAFELGRAIGVGGMSEVFEGRHLASGAKVAVKVTRFTDDSSRRVFAAEIAAMARMHHPSIVRIHDWGALPDGSGNWCAMDWAPQGALRSQHICDWYDLQDLLRQILDALSHAHARDVIHRDLKPQNVLVFDEELSTRFRLADFGLAYSRVRFGEEATGVIAGTPSYMAPEQLHGLSREFGPWTDLYALGCMAFELACGKLPFDGSSPVAVAIAHIREPRPALVPRFDVPEGFAGWVRKLLCRDWTRRPSSARAARFALDNLADPIMSVGFTNVDFATAQTFEYKPTLLAKTLVEKGFTPFSTIESADAGGHFPNVPIPIDWDVEPSESLSSPSFGDVGSKLLSLRETELVGHEKIRENLWIELRRVATERKPRLVLLEGHPNESERITTWFVRRIREKTVLPTIVFDASLEQDGSDPFLETLRFQTGAYKLDDSRLAEHVERSLRHLGDVELVEQVVEVFASSTEPVVRKLAARATFWELLTSMAKRNPVVLVMNEVARDLAEWFLIERIIYASEAPILVVVTPTTSTWQPSESERRLREDEESMTLNIQRLSVADASYVLDSYIRLVPELRDAWAEVAAADISFGIDVVRRAAELGGLVPTENGYRLADGLKIPRTLNYAAKMRVDAVRRRQPSAARALTVAAMLGRLVETRLWHDVMGQLGSSLQSSDIEWLMRHGFLRREHDSYRFPSDSDRMAILHQIDPHDARALLKTIPSHTPRWTLARAELNLVLDDPEAVAQSLLDVNIDALRESTAFVDRWMRLSRETVEYAGEDHPLNTWIRVVSARCRMDGPPQLRAARLREDLLKTEDTYARREFRSLLAIANCYLGLQKEAEEICNTLLALPDLSERLRAEALACRGWILLDRDGDKAERDLAAAIALYEEMKCFGLACVAAQYYALTAVGSELDARFDHAITLAKLSGGPFHYPRVLLERSNSHLHAGRIDTIDQDSAIAYRFGAWGTPAMRASFGANRAICLASLGDFEGADATWRETEKILHPDNADGRRQLHATRCVLAAIANQTERWDALLEQLERGPIPPAFERMASRFWERHGDKKRMQEASEYLT